VQTMTKLQEFGDRLKYAREQAKLTQTQLAGRVGIVQSVIANIENGRNESSRHLVKIAEVLGVEPLWLNEGRGPRTLESNNSSEHLSTYPKRINVAGSSQLADCAWTQIIAGENDGYIEYPARIGGAYAIRCQGDGLRPRILDGELLIVVPNKLRSVNPGDQVVLTADEGVMVCLYLYTRNEKMHFASVTDRYPLFSLHSSDIRSMDVLVAIFSDFFWFQG
jgi:transcriptional regulator with XRE-family HTH domain